MRPIAALCLLVLLAGCTSATREIEPIPGSITYSGNPSTRLTKSPAGSIVFHRFQDQFAKEWEERYVVQPDGTLKLVDRRAYPIPDQ